MRATEQYARLFEAARKDRNEQRFWNDLRDNFRTGTVKASDFSIRSLFESFVLDSHGRPCGYDIIKQWGYGSTRSEHRPEDANVHRLTEAGAVTTASFSNITGQIIYNEVLEAWSNPAFIADRVTRTVSTTFLDGERIAGIGSVADENEKISEGQPYPLAGLNEDYVDTPAPDKRGLIVPITREAIISDRTGQILNRARTHTQSMRINKERRVLGTVLGQDNTWNRKGTTGSNTYANNTAGVHNFDNLQASNALVDYTDVENVLLLFDGMTDPNTGEPIIVSPTSMIVPTDLVMTANRLLTATNVRRNTDADANGATDGVDFQTDAPNPLAGMGIEVLSNAFVADVSGSTTSFWLGDFSSAFYYMEVWPITSTQAPTNSHDEFHRDIVDQFKVSEFGVPAVIEPRYACQSDA